MLCACLLTQDVKEPGEIKRSFGASEKYKFFRAWKWYVFLFEFSFIASIISTIVFWAMYKEHLAIVRRDLKEID